MPDRRRVRQTLIIAMLALVAISGLLIMAKEQQMNQDISCGVAIISGLVREV